MMMEKFKSLIKNETIIGPLIIIFLFVLSSKGRLFWRVLGIGFIVQNIILATDIVDIIKEHPDLDYFSFKINRILWVGFTVLLFLPVIAVTIIKEKFSNFFRRK